MRPEPACVNVRTLARRRRSKLEKTQRIPVNGTHDRHPRLQSAESCAELGASSLTTASTGRRQEKERPSTSLN